MLEYWLLVAAVVIMSELMFFKSYDVFYQFYPERVKVFWRQHSVKFIE